MEINIEERKFTVRNDYAFKKVFGTEANKDILAKFLSVVTGIKIEDFQDLELKNTELGSQYLEEKLGRLDIKLSLKDGQKINIEMQNILFDYYEKRTIFYTSKLLIDDFIKGEKYQELKKTISINIVNQKFTKSKKVHSIFQILEKEEHTPLDDVLEIHFLDLTKLGNKKETDLEKWLQFIKTDDNKKRKELSKGDEEMEKAYTVMNEFISDPKERALYEAAFKYESDKASMIGESLEKGIKKGIKIGKKEGIIEGKREMIITMIDNGADDDIILKLTKISKDELENIKREYKIN